MANPSHNLGLSTLNGVTFQPGAIDKVTADIFSNDYSAILGTGYTNFDSTNSATNYLRVTAATNVYDSSFGAGTPLAPGRGGDIGFTVTSGATPGIIYGYYHNSSGYTFAQMDTTFGGLTSDYTILGFAYHALLVTTGNTSLYVDATNKNPAYNQTTNQLYIINLNYAYNPDSTPYYAATAGQPLTFPLTFTADSSALTTPPCFAEGTRVLTARGDKAVETLEVGDEVVAASGELRPVIWIGSRQVRPAAWAKPGELNPVRIRAHAFGEGAPARDLRLSPGHSVFVDGVLVPAGLLVNGATVVQEEVEQVRYFHVELDAHDVIMAEGLACESYLDDGNRETFANGAEHVALWGRLDPVDWDGACAPVLREGDPRLAALRARLHARAEALGWVKSEAPELELVVDGRAFAPVRQSGRTWWFRLPSAQAVQVRSRAGRLCDVIPGFADGRRLGVAIGALRLNGETRDLAAPAFGRGFYGLERDGACAWRWTDGDARLELNREGPVTVELTLHMVAPTWSRPVGARLTAVTA